ncbi:MAG: hypothetical protein M3Q75_08945 [Gemmatimonadota bacterium]|nr:hypothetical protein [Gemmatimonadota bacterium]
MDDTARTVLIALGVALVVVILAPPLFMIGMMGSMMGGIVGMMDGSGAWMISALVSLVVVLGAVLLVIASRDRRD